LDPGGAANGWGGWGPTGDKIRLSDGKDRGAPVHLKRKWGQASPNHITKENDRVGLSRGSRGLMFRGSVEKGGSTGEERS